MKTIVFTFSIILLSLKFYGQITDTYMIDFKNKKLINPSKEKGNKKHSESAQIKINNINPFLYKIIVSSKDSVIDQSIEIPALWSYLSSIDNIQKLIEAIKKLSEPVKMGSDGNAHAENLLGSMDEMKLINKEQNNKELLIVNNKENLINELAGIYSNIHIIDSILINDLNVEITKYGCSLGDIRSLKLMDYADLSLVQKRAEAINTFGVINYKNISVKMKILKVEKSLESFAMNNRDLIKKYSFQDFFDNCTSKYENLRDILNSIDTTFSTKNYTDLVTSTVNLTEDNFTYTSFPIRIGDDITKINIRVEPRNDAKNECLHSYSTQILLAQENKWKTAFSSGFYYSGLYNKQYYNSLEVVNGDSMNYAVEKNANYREIGINAMFHVYHQSCKNFGVGLGFGPGICIDDKIQPRLFLGLSTFIGDKNKFVISLGGVAGKVDILSEEYKGGSKKTITNFSSSQYLMSGFFSIGYSLFASKSKE